MCRPADLGHVVLVGDHRHVLHLHADLDRVHLSETEAAAVGSGKFRVRASHAEHVTKGRRFILASDSFRFQSSALVSDVRPLLLFHSFKERHRDACDKWLLF